MRVCALCAKEIKDDEQYHTSLSQTYFGRHDTRHSECFKEYIKNKREFIFNKVKEFLKDTDGLDKNGIIYVVDQCALDNGIGRCPECKVYHE